jgi:hypothetical protein
MILSSFAVGVFQLGPPYNLVPKVYYPIFGVQQVRLNVHKIKCTRLIIPIGSLPATGLNM